MNEKVALLRQLRIDRTEVPVENPRKHRAWIGGIVLGLILIGAASVLALSGSASISIKVATATLAPSPETIGATSLLDASGYIVARRQATVSGKITDQVMQVMIEEGQHVEKDEVIALLDDSNSKAAVDQAKATVAQSEATFSAAKIAASDITSIYKRNQKLKDAGWISAASFDDSKVTYDQKQSDLTVAKRNLEVAQKAVAVAQRYQDDTVIRAPFAGVVTVKAAQPGEIISPLSTGGFTRTGIGTIVDMDSLEAEVDVSENFINRVHSGQSASVKLNAYPDWQIPAYVVAVIPTADRSKATVKVRIGLKTKDPRIVPEMGARVSFLNDTNAPAQNAAAAASPSVIVPFDAILANGEIGTVFVVQDAVVHRRTVRLGQRTADGQLVLSGLAPGTTVAIGDFGKLKDGSAVKIDD